MELSAILRSILIGSGHPRKSMIEQIQMQGKLLKMQDVCEYFSVTSETVYRWIKNRDFPALRIGKQWFFKKEEIEEWIIKNAHRS